MKAFEFNTKKYGRVAVPPTSVLLFERDDGNATISILSSTSEDNPSRMFRFAAQGPYDALLEHLNDCLSDGDLSKLLLTAIQKSETS